MNAVPRFLLAGLVISVLCTRSTALQAQSVTNTNRTAGATNDPIARLRDEGLTRSQVMKHLTHLTEVIGPRLTGSPALRQAHEWTQGRLTSWGLTNARLEPWGEFGRGWTLENFSAQVVGDQRWTLAAVPKAWSAPLEGTVTARVVYLTNINSDAGLQAYAGRLQGAIVLLGSPREIKPRFEPLANRLVESNLLRLANAGDPGVGPPAVNEAATRPATNAPSIATTNRPAATNRPSGEARPGPGRRAPNTLAWLQREGVLAVLNPASGREAGSMMATEASAFRPDPTSTNASASNARVSPWDPAGSASPAQVVVNPDHYNRLARLLQQGESPQVQFELRARYHTNDLIAGNTLAEIPGTDRRDEVVMLGAHLDSWHAGTGATDNGAGVAVCMEAVRIIQATGLRPRRTIRVALWSGEEQGLLGSRAWVNRHLGYYTNQTAEVVSPAESPRAREQRLDRERGRRRTAGATERKFVAGPEYEKVSVYYNLDNGAGRIRGIYMQGNEGVRVPFRQWLGPLADLGAETLTLSNTGSTDHIPFDSVGVPGFQFIQDPIEYWTLTHHTNLDTLDRVPPDDVRQAAVVMAVFAYQSAMLDEKLPRKPRR